MYRKILNIVPSEFLSRGWVLALNIMFRAVLNFFSVALMVPLLVLILDREMFVQNPVYRAICDWAGMESYREFAVCVIVAIVLSVLLKSVLSLLLYRYERDYIYDLYRSLSRRMYIDYFKRGLLFVRQNNSAELSRRVNLISLNFVVGFLRPIAVIAGEVVLLGLILVALAIYDIWALCVVVLIFAPAICGYYYFVRRRLNQYGREENEAHKVRFRSVAESFRGYADVEVNNAFPRMLSIYDQYTMRLSSVQKRDAMLSAMPQSFMELAITLGMALLVVTGVFLPAANVKIVFGVFAVAAIRLMPSVRTILSAYSSMSHNKYTLEILSDTSDRVDVIDESKRKNLKSQIELHNVCFSYQDEPVIKDFNLIIKRGDRVGIQGSSGRGKSTLMNLLVGLLSPDSGEILIDGELLTKENSRLWQNSIGYVSQSVFLLDSTLKENIAFGVEPNKIDMDRLRDVISLASLDEFVKTLPDGVDSNIGEGGCRISGGERQRIGIARALYRKADVLLLDEATSSLDSNTQSQINEAIKVLSQKNPELTIVVIAHRASALDYCDYIVNM